MEIKLLAANCIEITTKKAKVVLDDNLESVGVKPPSKADIQLYSHPMLMPKKQEGDAFVIDGPGEYELKQVSVLGIPSRAHIDEKDSATATIYRVVASGNMIVSLGHIYPELGESQLESLGMVDILIVPVGGNGYTLDAEGAAKLTKKIGPKVVIPTHYKSPGVNYPVEQNELDLFLKELGVEAESLDKLKIKSNILPDDMTVYRFV